MITIANILDVEKYIDDIDVVIFDLDDTLYSEKEYVKSGFNAIAKAYPNIKDCSNRLWNKFIEGNKPIDEVLREENMLNEKGNCLEIYRDHFPIIHLYDGVMDMLLRIKKTKKLAMITDGRPNGQNNKIDALGIRKLFDKIIITDELGGVEYRKPNPISYKMIHDCFNVDYSKMIYIGDNVKKDIFAQTDGKAGNTLVFNNIDGVYYSSK